MLLAIIASDDWDSAWFDFDEESCNYSDRGNRSAEG